MLVAAHLLACRLDGLPEASCRGDSDLGWIQRWVLELVYELLLLL